MDKKKIVLGILLIGLGIGLFAVQPRIDEFLKPFGRSPFVLVLRDIYIATLAHSKAGDDVPFEIVFYAEDVDEESIDYARGSGLDERLTWGLKTNSVWIADKTRMIIPYFFYEGIRETPVYPIEVYIYPYDENESFHILGQAYTDQGGILINERYILEDSRRDLRQIYATLVHELIHHQGGTFSHNAAWAYAGAPNLEANTQAATIEVLAGMCHYRDELACKAFWSEIEGYARGSLLMRLRMYGYEDWYDKIANLLWRTPEDILKRNKSLRHWMLNDDLKNYYYEIIANYQMLPWERIVVAGICGDGLHTGLMVETEESKAIQNNIFPKFREQIMMFDDTRAMFGKTLADMVCRLPRR